MKAHCLIILATAFAGAAFGDEKPSATAPAPAPAPASARPSPLELPMVSPVGAIEERVKKLHETVALSQDQQEKLKAILTKNDAAMTAAIAAWRTGHTPMSATGSTRKRCGIASAPTILELASGALWWLIARPREISEQASTSRAAQSPIALRWKIMVGEYMPAKV